MNISEMQAMAGTYIRALVALFIYAVTAHGGSPLTFTKQDWVSVANALWAALVPVLLRVLNRNDTAYGLSNSL